MMGEEKVDDPQFHWWVKSLPLQGGPVTGVFTDATLTTAYVSGGGVGVTLYIKMAAATLSEIRVGHQVLLRDASNVAVDVNAKVLAVTPAGVNSYATVRLLEADDNGGANDLSDCDTILVVGNINSEGSTIPTTIAYDPIKWFNYTQIFRTSLDITRTARLTHLRTEQAYKEAKRESLELHSIELEKAFLFGIRTENIGTNGKPERTTMGIREFIKIGAPGNVSDYTLDANFDGDTWLASGEAWLDNMFERIFRFGGSERIAFAGSGAVLGINRLAKQAGQINLQPTTEAYGLKVMHWITPFGDVYLKLHPLFSYEATMRNSMFILEPTNIKYRYISDTDFIEDDGKNGPARKDGTVEEWLTECGLEYHHPDGAGFLSGVGLDNPA